MIKKHLRWDLLDCPRPRLREYVFREFHAEKNSSFVHQCHCKIQFTTKPSLYQIPRQGLLQRALKENYDIKLFWLKILKIGRKGCVVLCVQTTNQLSLHFSSSLILLNARETHFISRGGREQTLTLTTLTQFVSTLTLHWPNLCPKFFFVSAAGSKEKNNSRHISSVANLETIKKALHRGGRGVGLKQLTVNSDV